MTFFIISIERKDEDLDVRQNLYFMWVIDFKVSWLLFVYLGYLSKDLSSSWFASKKWKISVEYKKSSAVESSLQAKTQRNTVFKRNMDLR